MEILNVGAGSVRPPAPFINLDNLRTQLPPGSGARINLDAEPNYVEHDLSRYQMPFPDDHFDGILLAHCLEHFPTPKGISIMEDCRRMLKPGGVILVSVPDASYFREVYDRDENANWPELFDTTDPNNPIPTFFRAALFYEQHEVVFTEDALWCYFVRAGFTPDSIRKYGGAKGDVDSMAFGVMTKKLDRLKFSLVMSATKQP